jgi:hypothetical protein
VQGAPFASAPKGRTTAPSLIAIAQPARIAARAAMIFVLMPPRDSAEPAPPAIASISGVIAVTTSSRRASGSRRGLAV